MSKINIDLKLSETDLKLLIESMLSATVKDYNVILPSKVLTIQTNKLLERIAGIYNSLHNK